MADNEKDVNSGGAERRGSERLTVDLPARADLYGRDPRNARIMDFCAGGLFLGVDGQHDDYLVMAGRQISRDDQLRVTFDADAGDGLQTFTVTVKVARLFLGGMGVAFDPPDSAAIRALQRYAERGRAATTSSAPDSAQNRALLDDLTQRSQRWMRESVDGVFKHACDELFIEARDARNNDLQTAAMDALKDVERVQPVVRDAAMQRVLRALERLSGADSASVVSIRDDADDAVSGGGSGLSLVDTGSFDDWVTTKNIITRHEPRLREAAYGLARRLEVVAGTKVDEMANPLGLQQVASAFNEAMQNAGLQRRPRQAIYNAVEESLVPALSKFHEQLNDMLLGKGILPVVERPARGAARRSQAPRSSPAAVPPADEPSDAPAGESSPSDLPRYAQDEDRGQQFRHATPAGGTSAAAPSAGAHADGVNPWAAAALDGAVYNSPDEGMSPVGQFASSIPAGPMDAATAAPQASYQPSYQSPIQSPVSQVGMQRAYQAARSLMGMQRAMSAGAAVTGVGHTLAPTTPALQADGLSQSFVDALSSMQSSAEFNQPVAAPAQSASPMKERLRSALQRTGVTLGTQENEAIEVLGNLIDAVLGDPLIQSNVKPRIQRLSVPLLRTAMQDQSFFEQDAHPARQVINRLGMLGLPDALASGETGDSLQSSVDPILERMLADSKAGSEAFEAALPELDGLIARQNERFSSNVNNIVASREQQQAMLASRRSGESVVPRSIAPELEPWFKRTERLKVGDSVTFNAGRENPQMRTLAWVADDHETFVFADRDGRETQAVAQQELALDMLRGSAKVADSADVPAMDRGVYQMMHNIHRGLAEEGRRDSVTGLISLSVFESRVDDAIGRAQRRGSRHALLALNLDGFANINKQCGRGAGDSLLRKLSRLLERQIAKQGCVTRAFADEFLILLEDHPFQDARRFAERQCRAIEASRVVFEGEQFPITASIGMVPVTRAGQGASTVIENARAALAGAKRRGGNQLRIFDPDEDELPLRDIRESSRKSALGDDHASVMLEAQDDHGEDAIGGVADQAQPPGQPQEQLQPQTKGQAESLAELLQRGCLVLQRQLVSPIVDGSEFKSHYEVLLGVRDESDKVVAVSDNVLTEAERSEQMADVDRFVIRGALQWMAANRREVIRSGGYAINVSAVSFEDESLLEYVIGELTESSIPPAKIIFVVTESVAIDRLSSAVDFIRALREYGCRFAINDFGAGNATFAYLKTLPVDFVNIDSMFMSDLADSDNDYAMVKSINEISHLLGKLTIAKYADSDAVVARLKELGVDFAQGNALAEREILQ